MTRIPQGLRSFLLVTAALLVAVPLAAQTTDLTVLIDADYNQLTGCTVPIPTGGTFAGVEKVLITTVDESLNKVTQVRQQTCVGASLSAPTPLAVPGLPWNIGPGNGLDQTDLVETVLPGFAPTNNLARLAVYSTGDSMITAQPGGNPATDPITVAFAALGIPTLGEWGMLALALLLAGTAVHFLRRRQRLAFLLCAMVAAGTAVAWAAVINLDGLGTDWTAADLRGQDNLGDAGTPDLRALWARWDQATQHLFFRIDVKLAQPPVVTTTAGATTFTEDGPAVVVDSALTVTDADSTNLASATVTLTNPQDGAAESLAATSCAGLIVTGGGSHTLSISGSQPPAAYQTCLRSVTFADSSQNPDTTTRVVSFVANDGTSSSAVATRNVTVVPVDDPPVAVNDAATVAEDAPATAVPVLANDTDVDGGPKSIASVTQPANGTVVITGGGTGLTYQPGANYCNNPPGTTLDTFTYSLAPGGSSATVTMTVTCVDDPPVAVADSATVLQDSGATAVDVLANDTDVDGGPKSIASVTQPTHGVVVITGGGTGLTYQPNAGYCNSSPPATPLDTFTYTLTPGSSSTTVTMTVTCDIPPTAVNDAATVIEDSGANAINVLANDTDPDGGPKSVASVTQPANGTVVITGGGTGLTYAPSANYCNNPPGTTLDTFTYTLTPGSSTATVTVTVTCVDDPPVAVADSATITEDDPATAINVLANDTDIDGGPKSIASVTQPANGTVVITGGGTGLTYQPGANYCNSVSGPADTFTYTLTPGSSSTTVSVTVTCVDDPPVAINDSATVVEDSGASAVDVLANDTDIDGGPKSVASVTQPANGTVVITGGGTGVSYTPNANYCNNPPGTTPDVFTYALNGGSSATVTVSVTCVDDPPVAVNDAATVVEDSGANAINVLGNDTDIDGGPKSVASVTQPPFGTVVITGGGSGLTYQPGPNYCNTPPGTTPDTFSYTLAPGGSTATVTVAVTCVDDSPVIDLDANDDHGTTGADFAVTFTEGDAPKLLEDPLDATVSDIDSANLASLTVTITNVLDPGFETLTTDVTGTSITASYVPATGVLTLTGPDTVANFQTVLRKVTYQDTDTAPDTTPRVVHFVANDGSTDSNTATSTVTIVAVDTPPTAVNDSPTVGEDSGANAIDVLANDTDPDGGTKSVASVTQPANGTVVITGGGAGVSYTPNANYCNSVSGPADTFTYTLTPGSSTATVSVTVTCVDDPPVAVADSATVVEDSGANAINVLANDTDVDGGPKSIASVTQPANGVVVITGGGTGLTYAPNANYCNNPPGTTLDTFTYTLTPGSSSTTVTVTVTCVDDPPVAVNDSASITEDDPATAINVLANDTDVDGGPKSIGSVTQPANGVVVITGGGTGLTYQPNANYCNNPPGTADTFTYTLTPGGSSATVSVLVTCVDDPPVAVNDSATVTEDDPATAINVLANDTDVDGGPKSIGSVTQPANGVVVITGGGTGLTYQPNANYCNNPAGSPDTFTYTLTPAGASPTATVSMTVVCVNDPPVLATNPITYTTPGNTQLHVAGATLPGVASWSDAQGALTKSSPSDVDGPGPIQVVAASGSSTNGGSFSIAADGSFTYVPPVGFTGSDSFTYVVTDNGSPAATTTGTINVTVGQRVWYIRDVIDANNAAGGDGRSTNAFDSITAFNAATTNNGDIIYVFAGNTATTPLSGSITLKDGQKLWGQGIDLNVPGFGTALVTATSKPRIQSTAASTPNVSIPATAGNRNNVEVRGLDLNATGGSGATASNAIDVTSSGANTVGVTISDNNVRGATGKGINLTEGGTGAFTATLNNDAIVATGNAFDARTTVGAGTLTLSFSNNAVSSGATGVNVDGSPGGTTWITNFANNTVNQNNVGTGMSITSAKFDAVPGGAYDTVTGGTTTLGISGNGVGGSGITMTSVSGDLGFTNLQIFADGGTAFALTGTGAVNTGAGTGTRVTVGAGVGIFEAIGGAAASVSSATIDLQLSSLKSTNSASTGVSLDTVTGTFSAGSGSTITNATGTDFNVNAGNAAVTYNGTITDTTGRLVNVTNTTGGTKSFTGTISDTGSGTGQGVFLNANTGATISFTGALTLSTGSNNAFTATGGGTVTATDTTSTLATTTGTALNVANTTIGASGLKFRSISAGTVGAGPTNGIVLNTTGASGGLTVSGTGSANSGGTIQNTTGHGISLTSTQSPSFSWMNIQNIATSGIFGTQVHGFTLANTTINNVNTSHTGADANVAFNTGSAGTEDNVDGAVSITSNTLNNSYQAGIDIQNYAGTISNLTITNNSLTSSSNNAQSLGTAINVVANRSGSTHASITAGTVSNNTINNFPAGAGIQMVGGNSNSGQAVTVASNGSPLLINSNTITGFGIGSAGIGTNGIAVTAGESTTAYFSINSNSITNVRGDGVDCGLFGNGTEKCVIANNIINANNTAGSNGINTGADQSVASGAAGNGTLYLDIHNNTISNTTGVGILSTVSSVSSTGVFYIQNNTVARPTTSSGTIYGIRVSSGNGTGSPTVCMKNSGNTTTGSTNGTTTAPGIGIRQSHTDPGGGIGTFNIDGLTQASANDTQMENYVGNGPQGQNPNSANGTFGANGVAAISAGGTYHSATCIIP